MVKYIVEIKNNNGEITIIVKTSNDTLLKTTTSQTVDYYLALLLGATIMQHFRKEQQNCKRKGMQHFNNRYNDY